MMKGASFHYAGNYRCFYTGKTSATAYLYGGGGALHRSHCTDDGEGCFNGFYSAAKELWVLKYSQRVTVCVIMIASVVL